MLQTLFSGANMLNMSGSTTGQQPPINRDELNDRQQHYIWFAIIIYIIHTLSTVIFSFSESKHMKTAMISYFIGLILCIIALLLMYYIYPRVGINPVWWLLFFVWNFVSFRTLIMASLNIQKYMSQFIIGLLLTVVHIIVTIVTLQKEEPALRNQPIQQIQPIQQNQ